MRLLLLALLIAASEVFPVYAASFDCKKATVVVEKKICSDTRLSSLDEELGKVYAQALVAVPDREILKKEQRDWVKNERNKCINILCLASSYRDRITNLKKDVRLRYRSGKAQGDDLSICGQWEPFSAAFYDSGIITITSNMMQHEACKTQFRLINDNHKQFTYSAVHKNSCYIFSTKYAVNYMKIIKLIGGEITVGYFTKITEDGLFGEGSYKRIEY